MHLPFGVSNGPNDYSLISETLFELSNNIFCDPTFNPNTINSPLHHHIQPSNYRYSKSTPFHKATELFIDVPFHYAMVNGYIHGHYHSDGRC